MSFILANPSTKNRAFHIFSFSIQVSCKRPLRGGMTKGIAASVLFYTTKASFSPISVNINDCIVRPCPITDLCFLSSLPTWRALKPLPLGQMYFVPNRFSRTKGSEKVTGIQFILYCGADETRRYRLRTVKNGLSQNSPHRAEVGWKKLFYHLFAATTLHHCLGFFADPPLERNPLHTLQNCRVFPLTSFACTIPGKCW